MRRSRCRRLLILTMLVYLFLYLPLGIVIVQSFNANPHGTTWAGFTAKWYRSLSENNQITAALQNTFLLALASTGLSTLLGTWLGYGLSRSGRSAKEWVGKLLHLSICIPDIILAVSLLLFFSTLRIWFSNFGLGLGTMILAHTTFQIPFVALAVKARLAGVDPCLEEAAYDLGASRWQRWWHVTLPSMWPGIVAGGLIAFTLSLDDFVVSFFTAGSGSTTLPILIYSAVKRGVSPEVHALSTLIILASLLATSGIILLQKRGQEKQFAPGK